MGRAKTEYEMLEISPSLALTSAVIAVYKLIA